jgi:cytochrome c-type biogenesis protein CcmF
MIEYVGENLWIGNTGNLLIILSFVCSIGAAFAYFKSVSAAEESAGWKTIARKLFYAHALSTLLLIVLLFVMIANHMYQYFYVWQHSNNSMPMRYIFACFWEGQEGSFLLWSFWHIIIGVILTRTAKEWEAPVMAVVSMVQFFLMSMLLGVYFLDYKFGSNPFLQLTREHPDFANLPFLKMPDYLSKFDGRGLNPLLQNYWMTIHPPTLFLGFALTVVPFAYAIAALWTKKYTDWQKPALAWTFAGISILGVGILMGGAWAYEALSFGGFWAWDPVENASLVPWLVLVAGAHVMIINKSGRKSFHLSFILVILSFLLILYSTFLTRSGILGNSSVHAFTDLGMSGQLLVYLLFFVFLSIFLIAKNYKQIPHESADDKLWSREFWMFIGSLVFLLSAFQIIFSTSYPVINKIFGTNMALGAGGAIKHYNSWQLPFASIILLLMAFAQFMKYKQTDSSYFFKKIRLSISLSVLITFIVSYLFGWLSFGSELLYAFLFFSSAFAVIANADYFVSMLKGKFDSAGASIAHIGFGLLLMGALISTSKSEIISKNYKMDAEFLGKEFSNDENITLLKNDTIQMGDYFVVYKGKRKEGINVVYEIEYLKFDELKKGFNYEFTLSPFIQLNDRMGNAPEPDTRHFLYKDIYTHVRYADLSEEVNNGTRHEHDEKEKTQNYTAEVGDTIFAFNAIMVLENIETKFDTAFLSSLKNPTIAVGAKIKVFDFNKNERTIMPLYTIYDSIPRVYEDTLTDLGLRIALWKINPAERKFDISVMETRKKASDFIVMKAVVFPGINILWVGCLVMAIGTFMAVRKRLKQQ